MRWLVDGMNVIGSTPDGWWRDRTAAMRRLVGALEAFAEAEGATVAVVLDGRPRDLGAAAGGRVAVAFAGVGPDAADDEIARRAADAADPAELTVVTSDRRLAARAAAAGARVEGVRAFRARLGL